MPQGLEQLIDEITLDAYDLYKQLSGFLQAFSDEVTVPALGTVVDFPRRPVLAYAGPDVTDDLAWSVFDALTKAKVSLPDDAPDSLPIEWGRTLSP